MKNPKTSTFFKEIEKDIRKKGGYLITSHSFKSEDEHGRITKTKGPGRLSFQQFIKNNCLENTPDANIEIEFSFSLAGNKKFKELEASLQEIPMVAAMQHIKSEVASFSDQNQEVFKRFLIKRKKGVLVTLVFSTLFIQDEEIIVLYFDEITQRDADQDWGSPYKNIMFARKNN